MEAGTFDGTYVHRPVTGGADRDHAPTLALGAGPTPTAHLVWVRDGDLCSAVADRPGSWRQLRRLGGPGQHPDLVATRASSTSSGTVPEPSGTAAARRRA